MVDAGEKLIIGLELVIEMKEMTCLEYERGLMLVVGETERSESTNMINVSGL